MINIHEQIINGCEKIPAVVLLRLQSKIKSDLEI